EPVHGSASLPGTYQSISSANSSPIPSASRSPSRPMKLATSSSVVFWFSVELVMVGPFPGRVDVTSANCQDGSSPALDGTDDKQMDNSDGFSTLMHANLIEIFGQRDGSRRR